MPAPANIAEFVDLARKSGVLDEKRLEAHIDKLRQTNTLPPEPNKLAGVLVRDGLLTIFQAEQLLQGKWRRFTIGRYKVLEKLGQGGMGSVYLCEHILMRRRVAVKILPTPKAEDRASIERFHREARVVAALDHPNIVRAYDADEADNLHFLVMEHVDGASFQDIIKKTGPMDVLRACHYIRQAALGLQHAHEKAAIVHRDIKPGNILIDRSGIVKTLDMGLARFFNDDQDALTRKYDENVLGTADYLAPEQAEDSHTVDIRADIYSLGGTFYYCLTGQPPFAEGSVAQKLIWHQTRQPKSITTFRSDVPEGVIQILNTMMAKNRDQRFPLPLDVAEALAPFTQTPVPPPPESEMPQLSLAAMGVNYSTANTGSDSGIPQSGKGKNWQVSTATTTTRPAAPDPVTKPSSRPPGAAAPAPPTPASVIVAPTPAAPKPSAPAKPASTPRNPTPAPTPPTPASRPGGATSPVVVAPSPPPAPPRTPGTPLLQAGPVPRPTPPPAVVEAPAPTTEENDIGWEHLAGDTDDVTSHLDTVPPSARRKPTRGLAINQEHEAAQSRRRLLFLIGGIGGTVALVLVVVLGFVLFRDGAPTTKTTTSPVVDPQNRIWTVGAGAEYKTLAEIGTRLKPGDKILIKGPEFEEQLIGQAFRDKLNGVTIEGEGGAVVWKRQPKARPAAILYLYKAENLHIKGFIFDGMNQTENCVTLTGPCPGVTFENIRMRGYTQAGFRLISCEGTREQPVVLSNLAIDNATVTPVLFEVSTTQKKKNNFIRLESCNFQGPANKVTLVGDSLGPDVSFPANVDKQPR